MIDALGRPIKKGDQVAVRVPYSNSLKEGTILRVTPKGATISLYSKDTLGTPRASNYFVKLDHERSLREDLSTCCETHIILGHCNSCKENAVSFKEEDENRI